MLEYEWIDVFEGMDFSKTNESLNCIICNYYYIFKVKFRVYLKVCSGCHDLMQRAMLQFFLLKEMIIELIFGI